MTTYSKNDLQALMEGSLPWDRVKSIMSSYKDEDRFEKYLEILQEGVDWAEKIVLPIGEHLFIVPKNNSYIVKCECGYEFGDYKKNWKMSANIFVRNSEELLGEIYEENRKPDPELMELREFICPGCGTLLEVEAVTLGYPVVFNFLPELEGFYEKVLGKELPK